MSQPFDTIAITLSVQLGQTKLPIHQLLRMGRGAVIELDASETDDVLILAGEVPIARGQVVLRGERIGVSITEVLMRRPEVRPRETVKTIERQTEAA
jgi:flagellar motor switch protein FliN